MYYGEVSQALQKEIRVTTSKSTRNHAWLSFYTDRIAWNRPPRSTQGSECSTAENKTGTGWAYWDPPEDKYAPTERDEPLESTSNWTHKADQRKLSREAPHAEPVDLDGLEERYTGEDIQENPEKKTVEHLKTWASSFAEAVRKNLRVSQLGSVAQEKFEQLPDVAS